MMVCLSRLSYSTEIEVGTYISTHSYIIYVHVYVSRSVTVHAYVSITPTTYNYGNKL